MCPRREDPSIEVSLRARPDVVFDGVFGFGAIDDKETARHALGEEQVAFAYFIVEIDVFAFHAIGQIGSALADTGEAYGGGHVEDNGEVGHHVADGELIDKLDRIKGQVTRHALVDGGGVEKPVAEHDITAEQGGSNHFAYQLGAGGGEEEKLGFGAHFVAFGIVDDDIADLFTDFGTARLAGGQHLAAQELKVLREARDLSRFAAAFGAFEGDKFAGGFLFQRHTESVNESGPVGEEGFKVVQGWTGGRTYVVPTGADAGGEAAFGGETEELARTETSVEVIAGAGGDERFFDVGARNPGGAGGGGAGGTFSGVDDDGGNLQGFADGGGGGAQPRFVIDDGRQIEGGGDLARLFEIKPEGDSAERFEATDEEKGGEKIVTRTFFRIGEIEKEGAVASGEGGQDGVDELAKNLGHVRDHCPVDQGDEIGGGDFLGKGGFTHRLANPRQGDVIEAAHLAEHQFAVIEFDRDGGGRLGDGNDFSTAGHILKQGVDVRIAQCADISEAPVGGEKGIGHDRPVTSELFEAGVEFDIGTLAGGAEHALAELGNGRDRGKRLAEAGAQPDGGRNRVDEAIEASEDVFLCGLAARLLERGEGAFFIIHRELCMENRACAGGNQNRASFERVFH